MVKSWLANTTFLHGRVCEMQVYRPMQESRRALKGRHQIAPGFNPALSSSWESRHRKVSKNIPVLARKTRHISLTEPLVNPAALQWQQFQQRCRVGQAPQLRLSLMVVDCYNYNALGNARQRTRPSHPAEN